MKTLMMVALMLTAGCACLKPENVNKKECVVANQTVDCAKTSVAEFVPHLIPLVQWLFSGAQGPLNSGEIIQALEHMGFQFVGCTASELDKAFTKDPVKTYALVMKSVPPSAVTNATTTASPAAMAATYHELYTKWRALHPGVKFCNVVDKVKVCQ